MLSKIEKDEIEKELKESFISFYHFSISLIETLDEKNGHLKFAVVNMQIALELFLKYYFIKIGKTENVIKIKNGKTIFKDFSDVLSSYYSNTREGHYVTKKHLSIIMESRNAIVHTGKHSQWNDELANYVISCAFFIQGILRNEFDETLMHPDYFPHNLSKNDIWRKGAIEFANKISSNFGEIPFECPTCYARALLRKELFDFDDAGSFDDYQCLSCLVDIDTEISGKLITCCDCGKKAYFVELLNIQTNKFHLGCCFNCGNSMNIRSCDNCKTFYFTDMIETEIHQNGNYFCKKNCADSFLEITPISQ